MSTIERELPPSDEKHRGVLCGKCEHLNPRGANECRRCGSRLFVSCNDCGARNERVRTRCRSCGRRLHRPLLDRLAGKLRMKNLGITPAVIVLFVIAIFLALAFIRFVAGS